MALELRQQLKLSQQLVMTPQLQQAIKLLQLSNMELSAFIEQEMERIITQRREKQPLEYPSAGSTFKRPVGQFAGKLIEDCGLRGFRVGGAAISEKHCGFVVNLGNATCADVVSLTEQVRQIVLEKTGCTLEREIRVVE